MDLDVSSACCSLPRRLLRDRQGSRAHGRTEDTSDFDLRGSHSHAYGRDGGGWRHATSLLYSAPVSLPLVDRQPSFSPSTVTISFHPHSTSPPSPPSRLAMDQKQFLYAVSIASSPDASLRQQANDFLRSVQQSADQHWPVSLFAVSSLPRVCSEACARVRAGWDGGRYCLLQQRRHSSPLLCSAYPSARPPLSRGSARASRLVKPCHATDSRRPTRLTDATSFFPTLHVLFHVSFCPYAALHLRLPRWRRLPCA